MYFIPVCVCVYLDVSSSVAWGSWMCHLEASIPVCLGATSIRYSTALIASHMVHFMAALGNVGISESELWKELCNVGIMLPAL